MNIFKQKGMILYILSSLLVRHTTLVDWDEGEKEEMDFGLWWRWRCACVKHTYTQITINSNTHRATAPLLCSSRAVITFFSLSLYLSPSNSSRSVVFTKNSFSPVDRAAFPLTYLHHLCVNRPFLIRRCTRCCSGIVVSLLFLLSLCYGVRELI
jgi:hypothetical protein